MKETTDMRENWLRLINQMLKQADTLTVRQAYYLLLGFIGKKRCPIWVPKISRKNT